MLPNKYPLKQDSFGEYNMQYVYKKATQTAHFNTKPLRWSDVITDLQVDLDITLH